MQPFSLFMLTNCFGRWLKPDVHTVRDIVVTSGHTPAIDKRSEPVVYILVSRTKAVGVLLRQDFVGVVPPRREAFQTSFCSQPSKGYFLLAGWFHQ